MWNLLFTVLIQEVERDCSQKHLCEHFYFIVGIHQAYQVTLMGVFFHFPLLLDSPDEELPHVEMVLNGILTRTCDLIISR